MLRRVYFFTSLIFGFVLLSGCPPPNGPVPDDQLVIVFDPTILTQAQEKQLDEYLVALEESYLEMPQSKECVLVFLVGPKAVNRLPDAQFCHTYHTDVNWEAAHQEDLQSSFDSLRTTLVSAWRHAHLPEEASRRTSCVLSTLDRVQKQVDTVGTGSRRVRIHLLVVSDLLESCNEWGEIDLERNRGVAAPAGFDSISVPNLRNFDHIYLAQVESRYGATSMGSQELMAFWSGVLQQAGVDGQNRTFKVGVPEITWE